MPFPGHAPDENPHWVELRAARRGRISGRVLAASRCAWLRITEERERLTERLGRGPTDDELADHFSDASTRLTAEHQVGLAKLGWWA